MIACRIQHHPSRAHLLPALREALAPLEAKALAHSSTPPNPWLGYLACLHDAMKESFDHLLVIQDDAVPCPNFAPALEQVAASNPDAPVALFLARLPREASIKAQRMLKCNGGRYVTFSFRSFVPVVALLWPRPVLEMFVTWVGDGAVLPGDPEPRSDDAVVGRFQAVTRQEFRACVPSLVQHPDLEPSLIGRRPAWGKDSGRVALFMAEDGLAYEW